MVEKVEGIKEEWSKVKCTFQEASKETKVGMDIGENSQAHGREKRMQEQKKRMYRHGKTTQPSKLNGQKECQGR